jgi:hypothetical protein
MYLEILMCFRRGSDRITVFEQRMPITTIYIHLHDRIISMRRDVWTHKTISIPPRSIELHVTIQESK